MQEDAPARFFSKGSIIALTKTQKSIVGGMTVLGLAGIICKLVGVMFTIPLTWLIGADGLGVYQTVFPTYNLLLTVSSAGLPVAVSRMVSHSLAKDDPRSAKRIFHVALCLLTALGLICTILMLAGNSFLVARVNEPQSSAGFYAIAPCLVIVCMLSAFRGFMQGQQNMTPTAISQLIEQVGKVFISLPLAYIGAQTSVAYGAAGALLGITVVEAVALVYMIALYMRRRSAFAAIPQLADSAPASAQSLAMQLTKISIPITIGACIVPLSQFVDSSMLLRRMVDAGIAQAEALPLYGIFSGMVIKLINVPTALALAVSMSLVPAISAAKAINDDEGVRRQSDLGLRFAFLIGFPCSIGMSLLSKPILAVLAINFALGHWNSYYSALIYLNDASKFPLQIVLRDILVQNSVDITNSAVAGDVNNQMHKQYLSELLKYSLIIVSSAPLLVVYPFLQKYFIKGTMIGSIKG